jgi:hypothetical protein
MCPICVINPTQGHQIRFVSLADHIAREHDQEDSLNNQKVNELMNRIYRYCFFFQEDFDPDEDEDEGLPLYILAERLFLKEENRRQRLGQTLGRNDYHSQRRLVSRQTTIRGSRGNIRGTYLSEFNPN